MITSALHSCRLNAGERHIPSQVMTLPNAIVDPAELSWSDTDFWLPFLDTSSLKCAADLILSSRKASMRSIRCEIAHHMKNVTAVSGKPTTASIHQLSNNLDHVAFAKGLLGYELGGEELCDHGQWQVDHCDNCIDLDGCCVLSRLLRRCVHHFALPARLLGKGA